MVRRRLGVVRRELQRREPRGHVHPAFEPELFRSRFALLRRADMIDEHQREQLERLFVRHPRVAVGWRALQELYGLYLAGDRPGALAALDRFCDLYATGEIPEFHDVVDTVIAWSGEILAFHEPGAERISNGRLEGTNNKLQVLRRVATGSPTNLISKQEAFSPALLCNDHVHRVQRPSPHEFAQPRISDPRGRHRTPQLLPSIRLDVRPSGPPRTPVPLRQGP